MFSNMEMYFFTNIWIQIFFWFIKFRASSVIRYSIVVVSVVWNIPQKHHTIPAEVLPNDSEALFQIFAYEEGHFAHFRVKKDIF